MTAPELPEIIHGTYIKRSDLPASLPGISVEISMSEGPLPIVDAGPDPVSDKARGWRAKASRVHGRKGFGSLLDGSVYGPSRQRFKGTTGDCVNGEQDGQDAEQETGRSGCRWLRAVR